tara:strand:+ start:481 stop:1209 length:729 start_codon:yes stop_codon:yes gene_type:complete
MIKKTKKIAIFLAARSGSKRLSNKHFLKINSKLKVIDLCILRLKKAKLVNKIFLCTTKRIEDDKFKNVCRKHKIKLFRGNNKNVAKRIIDCAKENNIDTIVRITGDCPIIDPKLIDQCIKLHFNKRSNYTSNVLDISFPDGLDVEVIDLMTLIKSQMLSKSKRNQEHVTHYIRKSKMFRKFSLKNYPNFSNRRWTLDNFNDFLFLKKVIDNFFPNFFFSWKDLIKAEKYNKSLINIKERTSE